MKFSVKVLGADNGLIERLTASANRKLTPKLKRLAARQARRAHAVATHHAALGHPHATSHHAAAPHAASHRSPSHPAIGRTIAAAAVRSLFKTPGTHAPSQQSGPFAAVDGPLLDDDTLDTTSVADAHSTSSDGAMVFDVSLDPEASP